MVKKILTVALVATCISTSIFAFEQQGIKKGNSKVGMDVRYTSNETTNSVTNTTSTTSNSNVNVSYAKFITDSIEIGGSVGLNGNNDGNTTTTSTNYGVGINYNFSNMSPKIVPYVGVSYAVFVPDQGDSLGGGQAEAGLRIFISEKASITPAAYYQSFENSTTTGAKVSIEVYF